MRRLAVLVTLAFVPVVSQAHPATPDALGEQAELFWQALEEMDLSWDEFRIDLQDFGFYNADKYRLHLLETFFDNPWKISPYTRVLTDGLLADQHSPSNVLVRAQSLLQQGVRLNISGYDTLSEYRPQVEEYGAQNLAVALAEVSWRPVEDYLTPEYEQLPGSVRDAAALFCFCLPEVLELRWQALGEPIQRLGYLHDDVFKRVVEWAVDEPYEEPNGRYVRSEVQLMEVLLDNVDFDRLNAGATLLAHCVEEMASALADIELDGAKFDYWVGTQYGDIRITSGGDNLYEAGHQYVLLLDLSGNDHYAEVGGTLHVYHPLSVVIDLAGDDVYANEPGKEYLLAPYYKEDHPDYQEGVKHQISCVPSFGAGILGYGMLYDAAGNDTYQCDYLGQGCGVFGTGMLVDRFGDDVYRGIGALQGSGTFGTGVLIDNEGNDRYELYVYGQGYGFTQGVGLLMDGAGNDEYLANNTDIVYDGPHSPVINLNFAQGFGYGRRDDLSEGHSWMGGAGLLVDGGGNDCYDCGIYALGSAYWGGVGICTDKGGDDHYLSAHYTLAAPPHYALGVLQDDAGDDVYYGYLRQAIGHGRDWSLGWFEDSAGDDWYQAGHQSLGQGDVNSIGVFWDKGGQDTYLLHGPGFGQTTTAGASVPRTGAPGSIRYFQLCVGLFIDGGGLDRYLQVPEEAPFSGDIETLEPDAFAANNKVWHCGDSIDAPMSRSVGIDAE